jgi:hypothetical protein
LPSPFPFSAERPSREKTCAAYASDNDQVMTSLKVDPSSREKPACPRRPTKDFLILYGD